MLATYPEIRDRIYVLARKHGLRVDWLETTREDRILLLYDSRQVVVARARVPLRRMKPSKLAELPTSWKMFLERGGWNDERRSLGEGPGLEGG